MRILSFTFILCLLAAISFGQKEQKKKIKPKRTDNYIRMRGVRVGVDVTRPFQYLWTKGNRYGSEFMVDMELWPNLFPVFESGYEVMKINTPYIDYIGKGSYSRFGFNYNFLQAENKNDKNILFGGLRYGFSFANQQVNHYLIDSYFGPVNGQFGNQRFFAHWAEFLVGIKGEILHNFYMGWTIRGKVRLNNKSLGVPDAYFIPGYGKAGRSFNLDFTYSVSYNLPWDFRKSIGKSKHEPIEKTGPVKKPISKVRAKGKNSNVKVNKPKG